MAKAKKGKGRARARSDAEIRDTAARELLAKAERLRSSCWISSSSPAYVPPQLVAHPVRVSWTDGAGNIVVEEVVRPWSPAPGDPDHQDVDGGLVWTADAVRAAIAEAMETLRLCPGDRPGGYRSGMPDPVRDQTEAYGWADLVTRRLPTAFELVQLDLVLGWILGIATPDPDFTTRLRKAVTARAMGQTWRRVGRACGCSHTHAIQLEARGIALIVAALNEGALQM